MKKAAERIVYDYNENIFGDDNWTDAIEYLADCEKLNDDEITDDEIMNVLYDWDSLNWEDESENMKEFFNHNGEYGYICSDDGYNNFMFKDWEELTNSIIFDLTPYGDLKIWDENGHFYISVGNNDCWEVKELTKTGYELFDNWNYGMYGLNKTEKEIYDMIMSCNLYSKLPHFANKVYGCKKYEYEKKGEKTA